MTRILPPALSRETLRILHASDYRKHSASLVLANEAAAALAKGCAEGAPFASAATAGLVPYKTSPKTLNLKIGEAFQIDFSPSIVAERRVNRLKRSVWASGHLHGISEDGFRPSKPWFVTLTYADVNGWSAKHIANAVRCFYNWCKGKGVPCRYTWVAEIQPKRLETTGHAVVHYHLLAWLPIGVSMPFWDKPTKTATGRLRGEFWPHGMSNTEIAKSGVGYLMKYLSKLGELTRFPKGLRLYGIGGLNHAGKAVRRWFNLPGWVKGLYGVGEITRKGSGFVVLETGECLEPAYSVRHVCGGIVVRAIREVQKRFPSDVGHVGAFSSVSFA